MLYKGFSISALQLEGNYDYESLVINSIRKRLLPPIEVNIPLYPDNYRNLIHILTDLNANAFRFSISFPRYIKDKSSLQVYINFIKELKENNIEPFVTLFHYDNIGLFQDKRISLLFLEFSKKVFEELNKLDVKYIITFNEPLVYSAFIWTEAIRINYSNSVLDASKIALKEYFSIRRLNKLIYDFSKKDYDFKLIWTENLSIPLFDNQYKILYLFSKAILQNYKFLYPILHIDALGINYYGYVKFTKKKKIINYQYFYSLSKLNDILIKLKKYKKPIFITEFGLNLDNEYIKAKNIKKTLKFLIYKIHLGYNIKGVFYWSLVDCWEFFLGHNLHFGILTKDYKPKKSYEYLKEIFLKY